MKLTAKIAIPLIAGIAVLLFLSARSQIEDARKAFENDLQEDSLSVGRLFRPVIARTWRTDGKSSALYLIEYINVTLAAEEVETKMRLRWVSLDPDAPEESRPRIPAVSFAPLQEAEEISVIAPDEHGVSRYYSYVPIVVGVAGEPPGALEISESTEPMARLASSIRRSYLVTTLELAGLCALLVLVTGVWMVGRPVRRLAQAADRIGAGDLETRVELRQRDEIGTLASSMNTMTRNLANARERLAEETEARIRAIEQLRHRDRLASVGTFASGMAHELGTPLAVISGRAQLIADGTVNGDTVAEYSRSISRQADKMAAIIRQLLDFARRRDVTLTPKDLRKLVDPTIELLAPMARKAEVSVKIEATDEPLAVQIDGTQIQQVIINLVVNAIEAMPDGGEVAVELERVRVQPPADHGGEEGEYACCRVLDRGPGLTREVRDRLFEPFFTTKPVGQGTGLGLAVSYGILTDHGGWISASNRSGGGAVFAIYIPAGGGGTS